MARKTKFITCKYTKLTHEELESITLLLIDEPAGLEVSVKDRPDYVRLVQATVSDETEIAYGFSPSESVALVMALENWRMNKRSTHDEILRGMTTNIEKVLNEALARR